MTLHLEQSTLELPVRPPRSEDEQIRDFGEAEAALELETTDLEAGGHQWRVIRDLATDVSTLEIINDQGSFRLDETGTTIRRRTDEWYRVRWNEVNSVQGGMSTLRRMERGSWGIEVQTRTVLTSTAQNFHIAAELDAFELPADSSSDVIAGQVRDELARHGVEGETLRVVDYDVRPGVEADMGDGNQWPEIVEWIRNSDVLVFATPTWLGHMSSVAQRVLERLDAELSNTDDQGRPAMFGKIAVGAVVGNEDGAHKIIADAHQGLNDIGFTIPAQGSTYWNSEAMNPRDFKDLETTPDVVASTTKTLAANAAHLSSLLAGRQYPAV